MDEMYPALSGAMALERRIAITANNLANASTVGYCRDDVHVMARGARPRVDIMRTSTHPDFDVPDPDLSFNEMMYVTLGRDHIDFSRGSLERSGASLDVAIEGDAFFAVNTPAGERYTRQGSFAMDREGRLVTMDGMEVLGDNSQPLEIESTDVRIDPDGSIYDADGDEVGRLKLVTFENPNVLAKEGSARFYIGVQGVEPTEADPQEVTVRQGSLERSNISVIDELVSMIQLERAYQSNQKVITNVEDTTRQMTNTYGELIQ